MNRPEGVVPIGGQLRKPRLVVRPKPCPLTKSPLTPLYERGEFVETTSKSSPFCKGGSRGILLLFRFTENHSSIFTPLAKLNYTTSIAGGF